MIIERVRLISAIAFFAIALSLGTEAQSEIPFAVSLSEESPMVGVPFEVNYTVHRSFSGDETVTPFGPNQGFDLVEYKILPEGIGSVDPKIRVTARFVALRDGMSSLPPLFLLTGGMSVSLGPIELFIRSKEGKSVIVGSWVRPSGPLYIGQSIFVRLSMPPEFSHGLSSAPDGSVWEPLEQGWLLTAQTRKVVLPSISVTVNNTTCRVDAVVLDFSPLPDSLSPSRAIGRLSRTVSIERKQIDVGELFSVTVVLNGQGNLPFLLVPEPFLITPEGRRIPSVNRSISSGEWKASPTGYSGMATAAFYFRPPASGKFTISISPYPVLDPVSGIVSVLDTQRFPVTVRDPGKKSIAPKQVNGLDAILPATGNILHDIKKLVKAGMRAEALAAAFTDERRGSSGSREVRVWLERSAFGRKETDIPFGGIGGILMILAGFLGICTLCFWLFFMKAQSPRRAIFALFLVVLVFFASYLVFRSEQSREWAVLKEVSVRLVPDVKGTELFMAVDGDVAEIEVKASGWLRVRNLRDGKIGWIEETKALRF